ncbi:hypothetical protein CW713_06875 [Methanophagales archaeon]|nr:MAG: hypothetical protein CW713_06875 [Methanophagales archaeon]
MKKTIGLTGVVAMAMALMIAFSGVASASQPVKPTKETECVGVTTDITCSGTVVESQGLSLESSSKDILDNPPLYAGKAGEKYGKIKYDEKMIGLSGATDFDKCLEVDTSKTAPNLHVHKQIGYKQGVLGSLSSDEQVGMNIVTTAKVTRKTKKKSVLPEEEEKWKKKICPFKKVTKTTKTVPASCEEVNAYSEMVVTEVSATTETNVGITKAPVNLGYKINAEGKGFVAAGVGVSVVDGRGKDTLGSKMVYKEESIAYGDFEFSREVGYKSEPPT